MSNLQPNCCLKFDFQKVDQHAGGKWLIHDTKRRKDNQLQSLKLPCRISKLSSMDKQSHDSNVWDEIPYPFSNFNSVTVEVWELIRNIISHILMDVITYPYWDWS